MARNKYDVDESLDIKLNKEHLKRVIAYTKPYKKDIMMCGFWMIVASCLSLMSPYFIQIALDKVIPAGNVELIIAMAAILFVASISSALIMRNRIRTMGRVGQDIIMDIRRDLFTHLQKLPFSYYDNRPHGKILTRVVNYVNSLSDLLSNGIINLVADLMTLVIAILFMLSLNVKLTLISLIALPILMGTIFTIKNKQRRVHQNLNNKTSNMNAFIHESISGIKVTQAFVREKQNQEMFKEVCNEYRTSWFKMVHINQLVWPCIEIASIISTTMIYFFAIHIFVGEISVGVLVAFIGYVGRFWAPITNIGNLYNSIINAMSSLERIFETLDEEPIVYDIPGATAMLPIKGEVVFEDVTFMYEEGDPILRNMSFTVQPGDSIAIVGPTGAGKTTIVNLLSRFYNVNGGTVAIDGQDISKVTLASLRKQMGVMLQDSFIFSGTIMENIRYGKKDATDEEVMEAAKIVRAHEFITSFPEGYNTEVNERGSRLSVGQRQLISFARALLADPKILILDEATSSIDTQTEKLLQEGLEQLLKGRTSFIIAHRLSTIQNATQIFYVDKGIILEQGTHDELMAREGYYYALHSAQQKHNEQKTA